jgi:hypothetical protein
MAAGSELGASSSAWQRSTERDAQCIRIRFGTFSFHHDHQRAVGERDLHPLGGGVRVVRDVSRVDE